MKHFFYPVALLLLCASLGQADTQTREIQGELKKQGFYFGEADGNAGPELLAAVKRYQIRNGLEVTGQMNEETLGSLGLSGGSTPPPTRTPVARPVSPAPAPTVPRAPAATQRPRVDLRREDAQAEGDRRALQEVEPRYTTPPRDRSYVPPPADLDHPRPVGDMRYREVFESTPFASAPPPLQEQTLRAAQRMMASRGFYVGTVDGQPGPATESAVVEFQRTQRLRPTGRLDLETLNALHLLPGPATENPGLRPFSAPGRPSERREYRGIWVR